MPTFRHNDREPTVFERAALDWVDRIDRGLRPEEEIEFENWLGAHPQHGAVFAEMQGTWGLMDRVREIRMPSAAAITNVDHDALPQGATLTSGRSRRASALKWAVALSAAAALAIAYLASSHQAQGEADAVFATAGTTDVGEMRTLNLPDGSVVQLNTDSAVEVHYTASERRLNLLHGEAYFTVAKNKARPFIVSAGRINVRAVGTAFNVRLRSEAVEVLVTEGRVKVAPHAASIDSVSATSDPSRADTEVGAGQKVTVNLVPKMMPAETVAVAYVADAAAGRELAWQEKRLEFDAVRLEEIVTEFNRYNRVKLVITDPLLAKQEFGGTFKPDDRAGFVRALETNFDVTAETRDGKIFLRLAPDSGVR